MGKKIQPSNSKISLTVQEELFCKLFSTEREFFGNGVQSYIEAFDVDINKRGAYAVARVYASKLLTKVNVLKRINELIEDGGFNDANVDKQLYTVIEQNADFGSKVAAIREYNRLKKRITDKLELSGTLTYAEALRQGIKPNNDTEE